MSSSYAQTTVDPVFKPWIPNGWKLLRKASGDLNADKLDDVVLILEQQDPKNILRNQDALGPEILNTNPRQLIVLFKNPQGYQRVVSNSDFLLSEHNTDNTCRADPLESDEPLSIKRGTLQIVLAHWLSCNSFTNTQQKYIFRYENNTKQFRLIGVDQYHLERVEHESCETSNNLLTGKQKVTCGISEFEPDEKSHLKEKWYKLPKMKKFYLESFVSDCAAASEVSWCDR